MAGNSLRRIFGGEPPRSPPESGPDPALTAAYLDVDRRFSSIDADVQALEAADPGALAVRQWPTVLGRFSAATDRYLWVSGTQPGTQRPGPQDVAACTRELTELAEVLDRFHRDHRDALVRAHGAKISTERRVQAARVAAEQATDALADPVNAAHLSLRPVIAATDRLVTAVQQLDGAGGSAAADAVLEAAAGVQAALAAAPRLGEQARQGLASAQTRLQAVRNRAGEIAGTRSALLREFSGACSADLVDNDKVAAREAESADRALAAAQNRLREGTPDLALEQIATAREHLKIADQAVNAVGDRLRRLREVKADPQSFAGRTRFALRDAQLLAVQKRQVPQWGSVLDAQHQRVERALAELERVHPDYWRFMQVLADVDRTIAGAVDRMRGRG
jgi:hypothetical protein